MALPLDYGSLFNHHESANTDIRFGPNNHSHFKVRTIFQCANHDILKICACMHAYTCKFLHTCTHNIAKAKKDIAAGQEIFCWYGGPQWFENKELTYTDVDYASTRWRSGLQPLPCRKNVIQATGADGRRMYVVGEAVPSGTVLEISLCLDVPVVVVDQFPFLLDFVLTRETEKVHAGWQ